MDAHASALITLTTDFGLSDTYVGVMKGVILGIAPETRLVDLTHDIGPQNILEASARLEAAIPYFAPDAIHLVVVDPGVGSDRSALIIRTRQSLFVAPDNGVLTLPLRVQPPVEAIRLTKAAEPYLCRPVSATFHGRDIFAPVAAHLGLGVLPHQFGVPIPLADLVTLTVPSVEVSDTPKSRVLRAPVLYMDRFGNLITALLPDDLAAWSSGVAGGGLWKCVEVFVGLRGWRGIAATFTDVAPGSPLAYWGSAGRLEIAIRDGSAARELQAGPGDMVSLLLPGS